MYNMNLNQCAQIQKKIKWFPFMPWMAVLVILALFNNWFLLVLIAAIAGGFIYKAKKKLLQGAPNWYTAVQGYQSALQREEQARQMREMQANVQQVAADSRPRLRRTPAIILRML